MNKKLKILRCFDGMDDISLVELQARSGIKNSDTFQILVDELALSHYITQGNTTMTVRVYTCSSLSRFQKERHQKQIASTISVLGLIASIIAAVFGGIRIFGPAVFHG